MLPLLVIGGSALVLRPAFALNDFTGITYTTRQVLNATTTLRDCAFRDCETQTANTSGGAVDVSSDESVSVAVAGCLFENCRATDTGGAVYVDGCGSLSMTETSGFNCSSAKDSFGFSRISSDAVGFLETRDLSIACGSSSSWGTISFLYSSAASSNPTRLDSVNSSENSASGGAFGSGLGAETHSNLSLRFCTLARNTQSCCLFFGVDVLSHGISCVAMVNNSCTSEDSWPGLINVGSDLTLSRCVFQSNTFDYFLGTHSSVTHVITFVNCVFDAELNMTHSVSFSTTNCVYETSPTLLADCSTQPVPSRTATISPNPSSSATPSYSPTSCPLSVAISGTAYNLWQLTSGDCVEITIATYPIVVVFPLIIGYEVGGYNQDNILVGNSTESLAVYFGTAQSLGKLVISSLLETQLEYFAIDWPDWDCSQFFMSTYASETFRASSTGGSNDNFTVASNQNICMFHLSSGYTSSSGTYNIPDSGYDYLGYRGAEESQAYTGGPGNISLTSSYFAKFWWFSDSTSSSEAPLGEFAITFTATASNLSAYRWTWAKTSEDLSHPTLTPPPESTHQPTSSFTVAWDVPARPKRVLRRLGLFTFAMLSR
jgi:hypothetical protein